MRPGSGSDCWPAAWQAERSFFGICQGEVGVRSSIKLSIKLLLCGTALAYAGPVDFGLAELQSALAARNLKWKVKTELSLDPAENYRIEPYAAGGVHITGGDLRGVIYCLLDAAPQSLVNA